MTMDAFESCHDLSDGLGAHRNFHMGKFFNAKSVRHGVNMRADSADTLEQIKVLDPVTAFSSLLDSTVGIAETHTRCGHDLTIHSELEMTGLFQRRMLRTDGHD